MEVLSFFKNTFGFNVKIDYVLSLLFNRVIIDIYDFDDKIIKKHNDENMSLNDILFKYYGIDILNKVKYYSGVDDYEILQ